MANKLQLRGVHVFKKQQLPSGQTVVRLAEVNPYIRFGHQDGVLFIQNGKVFSEEGGEVAKDKLPGWFKTEVEKADKAALREAGWKG